MAPFKYKAFISYSHADGAWAQWLHRQLERYPLPSSVRALEGRDGPLPSRLYPIFRDREELPTSSDLGTDIRTALEQSACLVVICSPNAARSRWVNEEILAFKQMGRGGRILALIIDGEPNAADKPDGSAGQECFPHALRFGIGPDGAPVRVEPLAADARPAKDSKSDALLKIVAGLLGIGFDALKQRDLKARHRRQMLRLAAAGFAALIVAVGLWQIDRSNIESRQRLGEAQRERSRKFAAAAQQELAGGHAERALLIALEGVPVREAGEATPEAEAALAASYAGGLAYEESVLETGLLEAAAFSADGAGILTASLGHVQLWDTSSGRPIGPSGTREPAGIIVVSPDGKRYVTAAAAEAQIRDMASGASISTFKHGSEISSVSFAAGGRELLTLSEDGTTHRWDAATGKALATFRPPGERALGSSLSPDGTTLLVRGRTSAQLYDIAAGRSIGTPMLHDRQIQSVAFTADGSRIITVSWNKRPVVISAGQTFDESTTRGVIQIFSAATGVRTGRPIQFAAPIAAAALSPDGRLLIVALPDASVSAFDVAGIANDVKSEPSYSVRLESFATRLLFSPDGSRFLTVAGDTAILWDAASGARIGPARLQRAPISLAAFAGDGTRFMTASRDGPLRVFDATTSAPIGSPLVSGLDHGLAAIAPDSRRVVTLSGTSVLLSDADTGRQIGGTRTLRSRARAVAFNPDGSLFATAAEDGSVDFWHSGTGEPAGPPLHLESAVNAVSFSPDGGSLLTAGADGTARTFRVESRQLVSILRHPKAVRSAIFSRDGAEILTACADGAARLWSASSGAPIGEAMPHGDEVMSAVFTADGRHIVTASMDRTVREWDGATGKPSAPPLETDLPAKLALPSADGLRLMTLTGPDRRNVGVTSLQPWLEPTGHETVQLFELADGAPRGQPILREDGAATAALSLDGTRLAAGMSDRTARLWDMATGAPLGPPLLHDSSVLSVALAPRGDRLVTLSWSAARIFDIGRPLPPPDEREAAAYLATADRPDEALLRRFSLGAPRRRVGAGPETGCTRPDDVEHPPRPFRITQGTDSEPNWEAWRGACEQALAAQPKDAGLRYQLGRALLELDRKQDAVTAFKQAEAAGSGAAALALGRLAVSDGDGGSAATELKKASELGAARGDALRADLLWAGTLLPAAREEAVSLWRSAARRGDGYALERLALLEEDPDASEAAGDVKAALRDWAMAVEIENRDGVEDPYALARRASLARHLVRMGKASLVKMAWSEARSALAASDAR